ncbi:MAG: hypothetical protein CME17_09425 [Gemmatimonadetes bacterium]|nr:hypothetical protein [Gemmatimonadota bacterium]|tara:strand:- start:538 stop:1545 length:1008 start_codon:yes stop_codon:yes gene_type:complete
MGTIPILTEQQQVAVNREHSTFDAFRGHLETMTGPPTHSEVVASVLNTRHNQRLVTAKKTLRRGVLSQPEKEKEYSREERIKLRRIKIDDYFSHPSRCALVKKGQGVGVELEFFVPLENNDELQGVAGDNNGVAGVRLAYDASVTATGKDICREREARLFMKYGSWARLYAVCEKLREVGAEVNASCGLHVHLDCRDCASATAMTTRATRLRKALPWLRNMVPRARSASGSYSGRSEGRYQPINTESYHRHQTVEVRLHSGTLNGDKIRNWVEVVRFIALRSGRGNNRPTYLETLESYLSTPEVPDYLKQWVVMRTNTFQPVAGTEVEEGESPQA